MAIKLSDLVITSDIDGTLLNAPNPIPPRNVEAIQRFAQKGGRFVIATGRSVESLRQYERQLPINAPCIVFNGSGIYDYQQEKMLYANYLPDTYRAHIKTMLRRYPHIGAVLLNENQMHSVADMELTIKYLGLEKQPFIESDLNTLEGSFFKTIFSMDEELVPQAEAYANAQGWNDVIFMRSSLNYLEMLPLGCTKGTGLLHLAEVMGVSLSQMVSIGDYYNDLDMLKTTAFPVTVEGAPDEIKRICKLVTGPCENGALADLIEYLEQKYPSA